MVDLLAGVETSALVPVGGADVQWEQVGPARFRATFDRRTTRPADLARALFAGFDVADIEIPEPSIESVIRRIYREGHLEAPDDDPTPTSAESRQ